ncbi:MAG: FAD-binding oxidoreductase, partial [Gammaproteobacteria bacterium]
LLADGRRRSFSMANPPRDSNLLELHVRRIPGGRFTRYVFDRLKERALLRIEGPLGHFYWREESSRPVIMVAGGTGYAPIKAMLRHVYADHRYRDIRLYWGVRTLADLYDPGIGDQRDWSGFQFTPVLSDARAEDHWSGRAGLVHRAVLEDHGDLSAFDVYVAGPPAMVEAARVDFRAAGLPAERLFFDSFDYASDSEDSPRGV